MALANGTRLGPYVIEAPLGAGGMGEVYRAGDTRLGRVVALKFISERLSETSEFRERLRREARAVAALDHPHICPLFDVGEHEGRSFLVMPYLEGTTLARTMLRGPVPLDRALEHAVQLASALATAHRAGIVHRDIKPGNIIVTATGVKLLDFGLARQLAPADVAHGATTLTAISEPGMLRGTARYMSPEQLTGADVDARSDVFALGIVIYEMVAGRHPFAAPTSAGVAQQILTIDPEPVARLRPDAPPLLDHLISTCLQKTPDARWQSAADLAASLAWLRTAPASGPEPAPTRRALRTPWWLATAVLLAATALITWRSSPAPRDDEPIEFAVSIPPGVEISRVDGAPAISPDGRHLAFTAFENGNSHLFVRDLDNVESRRLNGTEGASWPFFSPDGQWIGFGTQRDLSKIAVSGGTPSPIASIAGAWGSWGADGQIVFVEGGRTGISMTGTGVSPARALTSVDAATGYSSHRFPTFLPNGRTVIYTAGPPANGAWYDADVLAQRLDGGQPTVLVKGAAQARYAPSGHLVYARAGTLFAAPLDLDALRLTGRAVPVRGNVREIPSQGISQFAISATGTLAYVPGGLVTSEPVWVDRTGHAERLMREPPRDQLYQPRLSPDAGKLVMVVGRGNDELWTYDLKQGVFDRLTSSGANYGSPEWTPDGARVAFWKGDDLYWQPVDRSAEATALIDVFGSPGSWTPDGRTLLYIRQGNNSGHDIWAFDAESRANRPVVATASNERGAVISPDGRWLAYSSDASGRFEIYVQTFPDGRFRTRVSRDGGTEPRWARRERELFFRQGNTMMAVRLETDPPFPTPSRLFTLSSWTSAPARANYDVAPDGRFVVIRSNEAETAGTEIRVVLNWAQTLKRLVPK